MQDCSYKKIEEHALEFARNLGTDNSETHTLPPVLCRREGSVRNREAVDSSNR